MKRVEIGMVLLAVVGLVDLLSPWVLPAVPTAPSFADPLAFAFGLLTLVLVGAWWAKRSRALVWVVVVLRAIAALGSSMAVIDAVAVGPAIAWVVAIVATVVGIVLVVPALSRRSAAVA